MNSRRHAAELAALAQIAEDEAVPIPERATAVLTAHQRMDARGCLCGFDRIGASWARHVAEKLAEAGVLRGDL